jgi:peptidoglycan/LPS O-acetylase OafA/YrhL
MKVHSQNAFDFLRIAAALAVLYSHSFVLMGLEQPFPIAGLSLGSVAVTVFFAISGYLVAQSWERDPCVKRFALRRVLRIMPALVVIVALTVFILGPAVSTYSVMSYFHAPTTWRHLAKTLTMWGYEPLPGVFATNPHPNSVNGSLWTLRYEFLMYASLALIGYLSVTRIRSACALTLLGCGATWLWLAAMGVKSQSLPIVWQFGLELDSDRIAYLGAFFFAGASLYFYRSRVPLSGIAAMLFVLLALTVQHEVMAMVVAWLAVPYAAITFAQKAPAFFRKVNGNDYSYGTYIYAFPIQQLLSMMAQETGWGWLSVLAMSLVCTVIAAALSWHYIEKPALSLKARLTLGTSGPLKEVHQQA